MGGTKDSVPLAVAYLSAVLVTCAWCWDGACLQDGRHKAAPGPEPYLRECTLYKGNSCCSQEHIEDITDSFATMVGSESGDRCGSLSPSCKSYLKRVACFQRCSADAAIWLHTHHPNAMQAAPLCHSFCVDWFKACKNDTMCERNWMSDGSGDNCTGTCIPFHQVYRDGRDLCNRLWGDAFVAVDDEEGGAGGEGEGYCCLTLSPSDREVVITLLANEGNSSEPDAAKKDRAPCQRSGNNAIVRKRSVAVDDVEGSSSGF